jgi:hypothetical protein
MEGTKIALGIYSWDSRITMPDKIELQLRYGVYDSLRIVGQKGVDLWRYNAGHTYTIYENAMVHIGHDGLEVECFMHEPVCKWHESNIETLHARQLPEDTILKGNTLYIGGKALKVRDRFRTNTIPSIARQSGISRPLISRHWDRMFFLHFIPFHRQYTDTKTAEQKILYDFGYYQIEQHGSEAYDAIKSLVDDVRNGTWCVYVEYNERGTWDICLEQYTQENPTIWELRTLETGTRFLNEVPEFIKRNL